MQTTLQNKALFLDRDGIINEDSGYVYSLQDLKIINGIIKLCEKAYKSDYLLIVVTNQSGIGRGYYTEEQFWIFMDVIYSHFAENGVLITKTYFAPYYENSNIPKYRTGKEYRKPNIGMFLDAQKEFDIDLSKSIMIGDKITDIQAGLMAGIGRNILYCDNLESIAI